MLRNPSGANVSEYRTPPPKVTMITFPARFGSWPHRGAGGKIERMIVPGLDFASRRIVGPEIASHAALAFGHELKGGDQLRRFVPVTARVDQPQRGAVPVRQWLRRHIQREHCARREQIL